MNQIQAPRPGGGGGRPKRTVFPRGYQLGAFTIDGVFGRGAFGVTYLAHDAEGVAVALKSLDAGISAEIATAFRREAEILGVLRHPNIVGLIHAAPDGDSPYFVLEQLGGRSLADVLAAGNGVPDLKPLLFGLLDALDHVHGAGFLHRDIKPDNIVLTQAGKAVLVDFGAAGTIDTPARTGKTQATPGFGALEQFIEDGTEGPWTDLYGLAATAYRMVTGTAPPPALERAEGAEVSPAAATGSAHPKAVLEAIDWALELPVHRRPQSVVEWRSALNDAWSSAGAKTSRSKSSGSKSAETPSPATASAAPPDDYPPTEEITRVTPPARRAKRRVPMDIPVAPGPSAYQTAASERSGGSRWIWAAVGVALLVALGAGGYFVGWPYYLRNIKSEWLVDLAGGGDVRTISEALETAKEGALIEVRPGTYAESLTIVRPVTLTGMDVGPDGPTVIVASETGACLTAGGTSVAVSGLFFQGAALSEGAKTACVDLQGAVAFQGNQVEAAGRPAMHVGGGADPVVTGNRLSATAAAGLLIDTGGRGTFRDNAVGSADGPGIVIAGASPSIEANSVEGAGLAGIVYDGAAAGRLADNVIRQSGASGIEIRGQSNPEITGNIIEASGQAGIFVFEDGRGRIEGNTITGSAFSGVVIGTGGKPTLTTNTITENAEHGVLVLSGAGGVLRANTIERNGSFGIAMEKDVSVSMDENILSGNLDPQIRVDGIARPFPPDPDEEAGAEMEAASEADARTEMETGAGAAAGGVSE